MILAVHQPNYLPWPGYFYKLAKADVFVILDSVQFPRGASVANRNVIKTPQGTQLLTVPVKRKGVGLQRYNEVVVIPGWREKHLQALKLNYNKSPYFKEIFLLIEETFQDSGYLLETNVNFIKLVYDLLQLKTKLVFLSSLPKYDHLRKNDLIIALCKHFNADCYLSGVGGQQYNQPELYEKNNLKLEYINYQPHTYPQIWGDFIPNLSIIDMLFNCGPDLTHKLLIGRV